MSNIQSKTKQRLILPSLFILNAINCQFINPNFVELSFPNRGNLGSMYEELGIYYTFRGATNTVTAFYFNTAITNEAMFHVSLTI